MKTYNIEHYSDGIKSKYSNCYGLTLEDAVDDLMYYDYISIEYTAEELIEILPSISNYRMFGTQWSEIKVTKK